MGPQDGVQSVPTAVLRELYRHTWWHNLKSILIFGMLIGCGTVALALAHERPAWQLTATDRSTEALAIARANAERAGVAGDIEWLEGDFEEIAARVPRDTMVVTNPPYGVRLAKDL